MLVEQAYKERLGARVGLTTLIGDRLYPGVIPDHEAPTPWVFFSVVASVPIDTIEGAPLRAIHKLEFESYSETYQQWKQIEAELIAGVNAEAPFEGVSLSAWVDSAYESVEGGHHGTVSVTCHGPVNLPTP